MTDADYETLLQINHLIRECNMTRSEASACVLEMESPSGATGYEASFNSHVSIIIRQDGVSVAEARGRAWFEGPIGLARRTIA